MIHFGFRNVDFGIETSTLDILYSAIRSPHFCNRRYSDAIHIDWVLLKGGNTGGDGKAIEEE
jgi:hypothetical protein